MNDVRLIVPTLDLYQDVWPALIHGLKKYWPDCPFPVTFITNHLDAPLDETVKAGGDHTNWGSRMRRGLKQIKEPFILWNLCDHWLSGPIDNDAVLAFVKYVERDWADRIRLYPGWDHDKSSGAFRYDDRLLIMDRKSPYRCSCKPSIWRRSVLLNLIKDGESPWDFERRGQKRSSRYTFLALRTWGAYPFVTKGDPTGPWAKSPVVKGKWTIAARDYCRREGLSIDLTNHPVKGNPFGDEVPDYILP